MPAAWKGTAVLPARSIRPETGPVNGELVLAGSGIGGMGFLGGEARQGIAESAGGAQ